MNRRTKAIIIIKKESNLKMNAKQARIPEYTIREHYNTSNQHIYKGGRSPTACHGVADGKSHIAYITRPIGRLWDKAHMGGDEK